MRLSPRLSTNGRYGMRRDGLPTLSRVPAELGRERRRCGQCGAVTEHIVYRVPKRVLLVYVKNHENNVQATCKECAHSVVLAGAERERHLSAGAAAE